MRRERVGFRTGGGVVFLPCEQQVGSPTRNGAITGDARLQSVVVDQASSPVVGGLVCAAWDPEEDNDLEGRGGGEKENLVGGGSDRDEGVGGVACAASNLNLRVFAEELKCALLELGKKHAGQHCKAARDQVVRLEFVPRLFEEFLVVGQNGGVVALGDGGRVCDGGG